MKLRYRCAVVALSTAFILCSSVFAETWNFTTGNGTGGTTGRTFSSLPAGVTVSATAWYVNGSNLLKAGSLGQYAQGLGVCNGGESCTSPEHQVDNKGQLEFVLFQFSQNLTDISFVIDPSPDADANYAGGTPDRDVTYWAGSPTLGANLLTDVNFGTMGTLFSGGRKTIDNGDGGGALTMNLATTGGIGAVLFGPRDGLNGDDFFKISSMSATKYLVTSPVPEPSSIALLGTVAAGIVLHMRRRQQRKSTVV
jgi:hypothetical protein